MVDICNYGNCSFISLLMETNYTNVEITTIASMYLKFKNILVGWGG